MKAILIICPLAFAVLMIALDYGKSRPVPRPVENAREEARKHQQQIMDDIKSQNARIHRLDTNLRIKKPMGQCLKKSLLL